MARFRGVTAPAYSSRAGAGQETYKGICIWLCGWLFSPREAWVWGPEDKRGMLRRRFFKLQVLRPFDLVARLAQQRGHTLGAGEMASSHRDEKDVPLPQHGLDLGHPAGIAVVQ